MKREFSFTNNQSRHLRIDSESFDTNHQTNHNKSRNSYKYSGRGQLKDSENSIQNASWTDLRVQEIKRKYDTPSYRNQSQRTHSFQRHNRLKTDFDYSSEQKKNQVNERFSSIHKDANKADYQSKNERNQSQENSFAVKNQISKYQVRAFDERVALRQQPFNQGNLRRVNKQVKQNTSNRSYMKGSIMQQQKQNKSKFQQDQMLVFRKIQQMKQSIMNEKRKPYVSPSIASNRGVYQRSSLQGKQYQPLKAYTNNEAIDPRVKNIDKINSKIKHILDCLHDSQYPLDSNSAFEQKRRHQARNQSPNRNCLGILFKDSVSKDISCLESTQNLKLSNNFQETKILERQEIRYAADQKKNTRSQLYQSVHKRTSEAWNDSKILKKSESFDEGQSLNDKKWKEQLVRGQQKMVNNNLYQQNQQRDRSRSCLTTGFVKKPKMQILQYNHRNKLVIQRQRNEDLRLSSGKKLDEQISRIQNRIKLFQQEKKKLQIDFKPFQYSKNTRNTRSSSQFLQLRHTRNNKIDSSIPRSIDSQTNHFTDQKSSSKKVSQFKFSVDDIIQKYRKRNKTQQNEDFVYNKRFNNQKESQSRSSARKLVIQRQIKQQNREQLQNIKSDEIQGKTKKQFQQKRRKQQFQQRTRRQQFQEKIKKQQFQQRRRKQQFQERRRKQQQQDNRILQQSQQKRKKQELLAIEQKQYEQRKRKQEQQISFKAGQGIQQRKRRLANFDGECSSFTSETKKLVQRLSKQAQIDQQFRNAKIWMDCLESLRPKEKVQKLKQVLKQENINMTQQEIEREFFITEEQNNPFYSHRQGSSNFEEVIGKYLESKKYWEQNVRNAFCEELLERQNLVEGKLDLERKGYIILGDIVRFLNIESGRFYRNRDIVLIWRRLSSKVQGTRIPFDMLLSEITQKQ